MELFGSNFSVCEEHELPVLCRTAFDKYQALEVFQRDDRWVLINNKLMFMGKVVGNSFAKRIFP